MYRKGLPIHFVGIGGIGMSGIAELLLNLGYRVSGSDLRRSDTTDRLSVLGAEIRLGHAAEHVPADGHVVVTSSAVRPDNPEVLEAHRRKIPVIPRAEMLASFLLPRAAMIFAFLYMFTMTMWPWDRWWLIVFRDGQDLSPDESWTRWHIVITTLYFTTVLAFNATLAVWASLRAGSAARAVIVYLLLSALLDFIGYAAGVCLWDVEIHGGSFFGSGTRGNPIVNGLFTWPQVLYTMLALHAKAVFAAIFYPVKWILWGLMVWDIARRIPARRWAAADDAKSP